MSLHVITDGNLVMFEYKVLYKLLGARKQVQCNHLCYDLKDLKDTLKRDGVTGDTVEFLYVHVVTDGGKGVAELVAIDNTNDKGKPAPTPTPTNVVPITSAIPRKDKPHIRLKHNKDDKKDPVIHWSYLFAAIEK